MLVSSYLVRNKIDVAFVCETWLQKSDKIWKESNMIITDGYQLDCIDRVKRRGGGIGLIWRSDMNMKRIKKVSLESMEAAVWKTTHMHNACTIVGVYHPPNAPNDLFIDNLLDLYTEVKATEKNIILLGDFNIHWNNSEDRDVILLKDSLDTLMLSQMVNFPTHNKGNTIDLIIKENQSEIEILSVTRGDYISDHSAVNFTINWKKDLIECKEITKTNMGEIDGETLLAKLDLIDLYELPLDDMITELDNRVSSKLEEMIVRKKALVTVRKRIPWFNSEVLEQKRITRRREKIWRKYREDHQWTAFKVERKRYCAILKYNKQCALNRKILECGKDAKKLYDLVASITGSQKVCKYPDRSDQENADQLASFFIQKIQKINDALSQHQDYIPEGEDIAEHIQKWTRPREEDIIRTINSMPCKQCENDVIPTRWIKDAAKNFSMCENPIIPLITEICRRSLKEGHFPTKWKTALVTPLIKNHSGEKIDSNYRPVSNLIFLSKVLEKIVLQQLQDHCKTFNLLPTYQSAYREHHSCETALIKLMDDLLWNQENGELTVMTFCDLSAAFDTVKINILLNVLEKCFGIEELGLQWVCSYLTDRSFTVKVNDCLSSKMELKTGVVQGSCLGPVLYLAYASTLQKVIPQDVQTHGFADDHGFKKTYKSNQQNGEAVTINYMTGVLTEVKSWMNSNKLKMNESKTELITFGSRRMIARIDNIPMKIGEEIIFPSKCVKYLGCNLDQTLSLETFVSDRCRKAMVNLHRIAGIRGLLTKSSCQQLISSLVMSHVDYCNGILAGTTAKNIKKLQLIQNFAAKIICNKSKYDSATECLVALHWLPIESRIIFKILLTVHNCLNGKAPEYLCELLNKRTVNRSGLRSGSDILMLDIPQVKRQTFAARSFSYQGPTHWNQLSSKLRLTTDASEFKKHLKSHLFRSIYREYL